MMLSSGYGQHQLHQCSKTAIQAQKSKTSPNAPTSVQTYTFETAASFEDNPKIPDPSLFDFKLENSKDISTRLPTVAECAAHLELLQAFHHIRLKILASTKLDAAFEIKPRPKTVYRKKYNAYTNRRWTIEAIKLRDETFQERRQEKWPRYLALAASRFLRWTEAVEKELYASITSKDNKLPIPPIGESSMEV
jgi:hypothetical protein